MNRKTALALVIASAACARAFADDPTVDPTPFISTAHRADVVAQMQAFRQSGIDPWADGYNPIAQFRGTRTRDDVTREYIASRDLVSALNGEDSGSMYLARRMQPRATELAAGAAADTE